MNIIEVTGGTKKQRLLTERVVVFCIKEMMPRIRTLDITVELKSKLDGDVDGYCWEGENNRQHFIEVKKTLDGDDFTTAVMHEMVHVKQQSRNEYDVEKEVKEEMEDEAYEKQEILLKGWNEDILQKILLERRKDAY